MSHQTHIVYFRPETPSGGLKHSLEGWNPLWRVWRATRVPGTQRQSGGSYRDSAFDSSLIIIYVRVCVCFYECMCRPERLISAVCVCVFLWMNVQAREANVSGVSVCFYE